MQPKILHISCLSEGCATVGKLALFGRRKAEGEARGRDWASPSILIMWRCIRPTKSVVVRTHIIFLVISPGMGSLPCWHHARTHGISHSVIWRLAPGVIRRLVLGALLPGPRFDARLFETSGIRE